MIIDKSLELADSADFANEPGTANVGDVIDLSQSGRNLGSGEQMYLVIVVETAADGGGGGNATVQFKCVSDDTSSPATNGTETVHFLSGALSAADLPRGRVLATALPQGVPYERYLGLQIVTATEGEDALVCSAFITPFNNVTWKAFADAQN